MSDYLKVLKNNQVIFERPKGHWLYPLFDLDEYLKHSEIEKKGLVLQDKLAGKAAACLIVEMGFNSLEIDTISRPALEVFRQNNLKILYQRLVPQIDCETELLTQKMESSREVVDFIRTRINKTKGLEIRLVDLNIGYGTPILNNPLNMTIRGGDALVVQGPNGIGKSTLFKTMASLIEPVSGSVQLLDNSITLTQKKGIVGYLKQNNAPGNMPLSVEEYLKAIQRQIYRIKDRDSQNLKMDVALRRTGGIHLKEKNYWRLSGGERQRVDIASLILQEARVFLLDEPSNHLDDNGREALCEILRDLHFRDAPTILVATHDPHLAGELKWPVLNLP